MNFFFSSCVALDSIIHRCSLNDAENPRRFFCVMEKICIFMPFERYKLFTKCLHKSVELPAARE